MDFLSDFRAPSAAMAPPMPPAAVAPAPVPAPAPLPAYAPPSPTAPPAPAVRNEAPPKPPRPPLTLELVKETVLNPSENPLATVALCLGLASILFPLLAAGGIGLGATALYRSRRHPWLKGQARAAGGIASAVILGSLSLVVWMQVIGVG